MKYLLLMMVGAVAFATGCQTLPSSSMNKHQATFEAHRTSSKIKIDGKLDEPAWKEAKIYSLEIPVKRQEQEGNTPEEGCLVRLLYDDKNLYVAFESEDSDVVALSKEDNQEQFLLGDVFEIFLKPADETWYWELHIAPNGKRTTYWYPGKGRLGLSTDTHVQPQFFKAGVAVQGTLNNWKDRDQGWTAEVAIPIHELYRFGKASDLKNGRWTILLSRYNYTRYRKRGLGPELTSAPRLSDANYHLVEEYAWLKLVP